jgi:hypothetical protein
VLFEHTDRQEDERTVAVNRVDFGPGQVPDLEDPACRRPRVTGILRVRRNKIRMEATQERGNYRMSCHKYLDTSSNVPWFVGNALQHRTPKAAA